MSVIVEIGAGKGNDTIRYAQTADQVIAVEAHPDTAAELRRRIGPYTNVQIIEAAVWHSTGHAKMDSNGDYERRRIHDAGQLTVDTITLDTIIAPYHVTLLKLNIEGAETHALRRANLDNVDKIVVACHDFLGIPTKSDVRTILEQAGFTVTSNPDAPQDWARDYLYATKKGASFLAEDAR